MKPSKTYIGLTIVTLVLFVLPASCALMRRIVDTTAYRTVDGPYAGSPSMRRKVQDEIKAIRSESAEQLIASLANEDTFVSGMHLVPSSGMEEQFWVIFCNRRFVRLWGMLNEFPRDKARDLSIEMFRTFSGRLPTKAARVIIQREVPSRTVAPPATARSKPTMTSVRGLQYATACSMFLTAEFGSMDDVAQQLRFLDERVSVITDAHPETAFKVNVIAHSLKKDPNVSPSLRASLERWLIDPLLEKAEFQVPLFGAEVTPYDPLHVSQGVSVDLSQGVASLTRYKWSASMPYHRVRAPLVQDASLRKEVLNGMLRALEQPPEK